MARTTRPIAFLAVLGAVLAAPGPADAQPLIRARPGGLVVLGATRAVLGEAMTEREPGTVACPYGMVESPYPCGGVHQPPAVESRETAVLLDFEVWYCSWSYSAAPLCPGAPTFYVDLGEAGPTYAAAYGPSGSAAVYVAWPDRRDVNLDGRVNVIDLVDFNNRRYDWNRDGIVTTQDLADLLAAFEDR